ncbi:MAG: hypothetical protein KC496_03620 [Anaerolineae bacterium]|nr:hypothetical protein [Anaerolineae bacterium]
MPLSEMISQRIYTVHDAPEDAYKLAGVLLDFPHELTDAWRVGGLLIINTSYTTDYTHRHQEVACLIVQHEGPEEIVGTLFESVTLTMGNQDTLADHLRAYLGFVRNGLPDIYEKWSEPYNVFINPPAQA